MNVQMTIGIGIVGYLIVMLIIGRWTGSKVATSKDYVLAGKRLPWWLTTFSLFATWYGAETCMGASGYAYVDGFLGVIADPFGAALCLILFGLFFAKALSRMNYLTLADFLRDRFGKGMGYFATICFITAYLLWLSSQLLAIGTILHAAINIPPLLAMTVGCAIVTFYTYRGGLLADAWTDLIQAIVLIPSFILLFWMVLEQLGGWSQFINQVPKETFDMLPKEHNFTAWIVYLQAWAVLGIGSLPSQDLYQRVSGAKNEKVAQTSCFLAAGLYLTVGMIPVFLGIAGKILAPDLEHSDHVLMHLAVTYLPTWGMILFIGGLLSAIMSTADSVILAPATLFTENILKPFFKDTSDGNILRWCRRMTLVVTSIALTISVTAFLSGGENLIYTLTETSSAVLLGTVLVPFIAAFYFKHFGTRSAWLTVAAGVVGFVFAKLSLPDCPPSLISFAASLLVCALCYLASLKWSWDATPQKL